MIAERITPEVAARLLAAIDASKEALAFLENLPMWLDSDPAMATQEAADVGLRLRAALEDLGALPGKR